jgi:hypothetical protein
VGLTVAIMQPYFLPYAGYFRLISESDLFVVYDCVQFPRRGWLHRNKLIDRGGEARWLTLPLKGCPQDTLIRDLEFPPDAAAEMADRLRPFSLEVADPGVAGLIDQVRGMEGRPLDYIAGLLRSTSRLVGLDWNIVHSTSLDVPASFRGQDRILEICRRVGASRYVNAPGGRGLYDPQDFARAGVELRFLEPYAGPGGSVLQRLIDAGPDQVRAEVLASGHG